MGDPPESPRVGTPQPTAKGSSHLPILYYALVVAAATALVLFSFVALKYFYRRQVILRPTFPSTARTSLRIGNTSFIASFEYKKDGDNDHECAVCLSAFEEGEEIRQLPNCKHSFHMPCIDMWLYSHVDCPLCRCLVEPPLLRQQRRGTEQLGHSREMLLGRQGPGTVDISPLVL